MTNFKSVVLMLVLGLLGALMSGAALLMTDVTDGTFDGYGNWFSEQFPVLAVVVAMGFVAGMLIALLWSVLQQIFATNAPRA